MYEPPKPTQKTKERANITKMFLLLFFVAFVASSLGFIRGQNDTPVAEVHRAGQLAAPSGGSIEVRGKDGRVIAGVSVRAPEKAKNPCKTGKEKECLNKCTTSYKMSDSTIKTCEVKKVSELSKLMNEVLKCASNKSIVLKKEYLIKSACTVGFKADKDAATSTRRTLKKTRLERGVLATELGGKCKDKLKSLKEGIDKRYNSAEKIKASEEDAKSCEDKGSVTCIPAKGGKGYECWPKKGGGKDGPSKNKCKKNPKLKGCTSTTTTPPGGPPDSPYGRGFGDGYSRGYGDAKGSGIGSGSGKGMPELPKPGGGKKGGGSGGGSGGGGAPSGCNSYYYRLLHPSKCRVGKRPTCLLLLNKSTVKRGESLRVKWQTQYAESVTLSTNTGASIDSSAKSGSKTIYPKTSGFIKLVAKGKGRGGDDDGGAKTKECLESVTVSGSGGEESGEYPPRMSCVPDSVQEGKRTKVSVNWSCSGGGPTKAVGVNLNTQDKTTGSATMYPAVSTRYEVSCYKGSEIIGKNSCSVLVEKPIFDIIVWPTSASTDEKVRVSWGSLGMTTCRVVGPGNFLYEQANGVVVTTPFPEGSNDDEAVYTIECASKFGKTSTRDVVVDKK